MTKLNITPEWSKKMAKLEGDSEWKGFEISGIDMPDDDQSWNVETGNELPIYFRRFGALKAEICDSGKNTFTAEILIGEDQLATPSIIYNGKRDIPDLATAQRLCVAAVRQYAQRIIADSPAGPVPTPDLVEIEARLDAATPGPWDIGGGFDEAFSVWRKDRRPDVLASYIEREADAVFMAHAREDVAAMLAHIDMLSRTVLGQATELQRLRSAETVDAAANGSDSPMGQRALAWFTEGLAKRRIPEATAAAPHHPECDTCNDTGEIDETLGETNHAGINPCPDCTSAGQPQRTQITVVGEDGGVGVTEVAP